MVVEARPVEQLLTLAQFEQMSEYYDGPFELIDGSIVEIMSGDNHGRIARRLEHAIWEFDPKDQIGLTWRDTTIKVAGDDGNGRKPDIAYITANRVPPGSDTSLSVIPDLVVEVWSPSDVDGKAALKSTLLKMRYWPHNGVRITWCINPAAKEVEISYAGNETPAKVLGLNDDLDGEDVIPGFKMKVAALF